MNDREKIQAVLNTLEQMMIPATYDNVNRMLGIYQTLMEVRDGKKETMELFSAGEKIGEEAVTEDG